MMHPLSVGTRVAFDIEDLVAGTAVVAEVDYDEGWAYRLTAVALTIGDVALLNALADVEPDGSIWACEHEVRPVAAEVCP